MKILLIGASISGLTLANLLASTNWTVRLVDANLPAAGPGRPLGVWRHGRAILADLEVDDPFFEKSVAVDRWDLRGADGQLLKTLPIAADEADEELRLIDGAELRALLRDRLPDDTIEANRSIDAIDFGEDFAEITFGDGTLERFDLVIGADGMDSTLRSLTFDGWRIKPTHTTTLGFSSPGEALASPTKVLGDDGSLLRLVPAQNHTLVDLTVAGRHKKEIADPLAFLGAQCGNFGGILSEIVEALPPDSDLFVERNRQVIAANWYHDRAILVGDAAHGLDPIVEVRASMALEDARLLFEILCDKAPEHVDVALRDYAARRKKRIRRFQRAARRARRILLHRSSMVAQGRNLLLRRTSWLDDLFVTDDSV